MKRTKLIPRRGLPDICSIKYFGKIDFYLRWMDTNKTFTLSIWKRNNPGKQLTLMDIWYPKERE